MGTPLAITASTILFLTTAFTFLLLLSGILRFLTTTSLHLLLHGLILGTLIPALYFTLILCQDISHRDSTPFEIVQPTLTAVSRFVIWFNVYAHFSTAGVIWRVGIVAAGLLAAAGGVVAAVLRRALVLLVVESIGTALMLVGAVAAMWEVRVAMTRQFGIGWGVVGLGISAGVAGVAQWVKKDELEWFVLWGCAEMGAVVLCAVLPGYGGVMGGWGAVSMEEDAASDDGVDHTYDDVWGGGRTRLSERVGFSYKSLPGAGRKKGRERIRSWQDDEAMWG